MNIGEIIEKAGGELALAMRFKLHQTSVSNWKKKGIPEKYWKEIIDQAHERKHRGVSVNVIFQANRAIEK